MNFRCEVGVRTDGVTSGHCPHHGHDLAGQGNLGEPKTASQVAHSFLMFRPSGEKKRRRQSVLFTKNLARGEENREGSLFNISLTRHATHVYECRRRTAKLVIPRESTPLRSSSTWSKSSSLHTSRESPVLPEGRRHKAFALCHKRIQAAPLLYVTNPLLLKSVDHHHQGWGSTPTLTTDKTCGTQGFKTKIKIHYLDERFELNCTKLQ